MPIPFEEPACATTRKLNEFEGKRLLASLGLTTSPDILAGSAEEASEAASQIGYPVALKIVSPDIAHKSEVGGVVLGLSNQQDVHAAAERMLHNIADAAPDCRIDGILVSPMVTGGTECIIGLERDPVFGPVTMFGLGGVAVELLRDVAFRVGAIDETEALSMIRETRCFPLLDRFRGRLGADIDALASAIVCLSAAGSNAAGIAAAEVNPLLVMPEGEGAIALDAVVEVFDRAV